MAVGIACYTIACEGVENGVEALWNAWVRGESTTRYSVGNSGEWRARAQACVRQVMGSGWAPERTGLVIATTKGDIDAEVAWIRERDRGGESRLGPPALAAGFADKVAWIVSTACSSGLVALIDAACCLLDGEADAMVVCGFDAAGNFVRDGFGALKAVSPAGICRPFDRDRDGLMLGGGAAACRLVRGGGGKRDSQESTGVALTGWGLASDAVHMTAPDRAGAGLVRAMEAALRQARLEPGDIDVILAHGTGTRYNDAMEAVAFANCFGAGNARGPAITAVKGLIGHTLGASGLIEGLLAARMIEMQSVPPIVGLREPERAGLDFVRETRATPVRHVMKVASGFGGLNAAVIFSRTPEAS